MTAKRLNGRRHLLSAAEVLAGVQGSASPRRAGRCGGRRQRRRPPPERLVRPTSVSPRHARTPHGHAVGTTSPHQRPGTPGPRGRAPAAVQSPPTRDRQGGRTSSDQARRRYRQACRGLPGGERENSHHVKDLDAYPRTDAHPSTHPQLGRAKNPPGSCMTLHCGSLRQPLGKTTAPPAHTPVHTQTRHPISPHARLARTALLPRLGARSIDSPRPRHAVCHGRAGTGQRLSILPNPLLTFKDTALPRHR